MADDDDDLLEAEYVEYHEQQETPHVIYQANGGMPCCSACGCLVVGIILLVLFNFGAVVSTLFILLLAAWTSALLLRLSGVRRYSPIYVYIMVPVFLVVANFLAKLFRGEAPYSAGEIALATAVVYAFLAVAQLIAHRRRL